MLNKHQFLVFSTVYDMQLICKAIRVGTRLRLARSWVGFRVKPEVDQAGLGLKIRTYLIFGSDSGFSLARPELDPNPTRQPDRF